MVGMSGRSFGSDLCRQGLDPDHSAKRGRPCTRHWAANGGQLFLTRLGVARDSWSRVGCRCWILLFCGSSDVG